MKLFPMTEDEYHYWLNRSKIAYAADKMKANGLSQEQADKIAAEDFERNLPAGLQSKECLFFALKNPGEKAIGFLLLLVRGPENDRRAFVGDVIIEEEYRGLGYGKRIMQLLEDEVNKLGLTRIGLHVFGYNEPAIQLYKKLGYLTTDLVMEKKLNFSR